MFHLRVMGGEEFDQAVDTLLESLELKLIPGRFLQYPLRRGKRSTKPKQLRKLSIFPDKEGKTRVIAIFDYFSQTCLKPLHHFLYRILERIPQDCTFDQARFQKTIMNQEEYYSIDLSAFTDRFPIDFIVQVLEPILPARYLSSWKKVMVGLPFDVKKPNGDESLYYAVGTPMGGYSS